MAIRVTQQFLEYAADPTTESDVRVTRVFAQVAVVISDAQVIKNASNTFALAAAVEQGGNTLYVGISNTIFDDAADNAVTYDPIFNVIATNKMLSQDLTSNYYVCSNTFFDGSESNLAGRNYDETVVQYLGFTDRYFAPDIGNSIGFDGKAAEAVVDSCANYVFTATDSAEVVQAYNAESVIGFTATVFPNTPLQLSNEIGFSNDVMSIGPQSRTLGETGFIKQSVGFTISNSKCREKEYAPMIGEGAPEFANLAIDAPTLSTGTLTLTYPLESPTLTLTLENPDFGNTDELSFTRIDRDTRGGDRKIFSDPKWARWERLEGVVRELCEVDADEIIAFLQASLGKEIGLLDWEGRNWAGFIFAPETEITKQSSGWAFQLSFEGKLTTADVQHDGDNVIHGQDENGNDIEVEHND